MSSFLALKRSITSSFLSKTLNYPINPISPPPSFTISRFFSSARKKGNGTGEGKYRKQFKGKMGGICHKGDRIAFGTYGLQALTCSWVTARQLEAGRRAMTRNARGGKFWVRLICDKPVTQKPAETRMGRGKGNVAYRVAVIQANRILYEMSGVAENIARAAIKVAASKMPMKTRFVKL